MGTETEDKAAPPLVIDSHRPARREHPLRAWRRRQMVWDDVGKCRRSMRLQDVPVAYDIPMSTWHGWERWPDEKGYRRPDDPNMQRLFEITLGEVTPDNFYPLDEWRAALPRERKAG